jgi:hypothetical protein
MFGAVVQIVAVPPRSPLSVNILTMARQPRKYVENATPILSVASFMRGRVLQPGRQYDKVLPGNLIARLECRPDAAYLIIADRTYQLLPLLLPSNYRQKMRPVKWLIIDSTGRRVQNLYRDGNRVGSRWELALWHRPKQYPRAYKYLRGLNAKEIDDGREIIRLQTHRPNYQHVETFIRNILRSRGVPSEQLTEATTSALTDWDATRQARRPKYTNLARVNQRRHSERLEREQRQAEGGDEPILGYRSG